MVTVLDYVQDLRSVLWAMRCIGANVQDAALQDLNENAMSLMFQYAESLLRNIEGELKPEKIQA